LKLKTVNGTALSSPAMGHWGTCPVNFQQLNFSGHFRAAHTLTVYSMWLPIQKGYAGLQPCQFVTAYCVNFMIFLCVTLKLFSLSFVALLAPNPGDVTEW